MSVISVFIGSPHSSQVMVSIVPMEVDLMLDLVGDVGVEPCKAVVVTIPSVSLES